MKQLFLSFLLLLLPTFFFAQSTWNMALPGTSYVDECIATYDGGVVVLTYFQNKIHKLDASGNLLWTFVLDTTDMQYFISVTETEDHNIVALGSSTSYSGTSAFKLDQNGTLLWQKVYSSPFGNLSGQFICASHDDGGFLFGGGECALQFYATKCDSAGNILWTQEHAGLTASATGFFSGMVQAPGNGYVATYSTLNTGDLDWGILKMDNNGSFLWAKTVDEGIARDEVSDVVATVDGGIAVLGQTTNYQGSSNEYMMTLTTFDGSGNRLSYHVYDYGIQLQPRSLTQTIDGGFVLTGSTYDVKTLLVKTDVQGAIQWQKLGVGAVSQEGFGLAPAPGGMLYFSAWDYTHKATIAKMSPLTGVGICTESTITLSPATYTPPIITPQVTPFAGTLNAVTLNYAHHLETAEATLICTFVAIETQVTEFSLKAGPNPFVSNLQLDFGQKIEADGTLLLYDMQGSLVTETFVLAGTQVYNWNLGPIPAGMLLLKFESAGKSCAIRLVKLPN